MKGFVTRFCPLAVASAFALMPGAASACSACFGRSDSSLAEGMNMGIFSLLLVVLFVLGGIGAFFIFLARRASAAGRQASPEHPQPPNSVLP